MAGLFEITIKNVSSVVANSSMLNKEGKVEMNKAINRISIFKEGKKEEDKNETKEDENLPPKGSFEKIMSLFGGGGRK